jgi:hypothetical protein
MSSIDIFVQARPFVERARIHISSRTRRRVVLSRELGEYDEINNCFLVPGSYRRPIPKPRSSKHNQTPQAQPNKVDIQ